MTYSGYSNLKELNFNAPSLLQPSTRSLHLHLTNERCCLWLPNDWLPEGCQTHISLLVRSFIALFPLLCSHSSHFVLWTLSSLLSPLCAAATDWVAVHASSWALNLRAQDTSLRTTFSVNAPHWLYSALSVHRHVQYFTRIVFVYSYATNSYSCKFSSRSVGVQFVAKYPQYRTTETCEL